MDDEITMNLRASTSATPTLRTRIKVYKKKAIEMNDFLKKYPEEWGRYQSVFNFEINGIFREIMNFEKENLQNGKEKNVYKLKRLFVNRIQKEFLHGEYINWSLSKPFGYAGDYKIIDEIYLNSPRTVGFDRLYDNYFQMSAISVAVRNRKDDFKRLISEVVKNKNAKVRIMDLGSGPCREWRELFSDGIFEKHRVIVDCFDGDERAHTYSGKFLEGASNINFIKENVVRLALKKDIQSWIPEKYDLIYSSGLFDYLDERVSIRLIRNLRKLLNDGGKLIISDVRDKYSNPSVHFMEWVGDWSLIYRDDDNFRQFFLEAGFKEKELQVSYEQQGIMQYVIASK